MILNDWIDHLARMLAKARVGGSVYMDGRHNPVPSEYQAAKRFISDFLNQYGKSAP